MNLKCRCSRRSRRFAGIFRKIRLQNSRWQQFFYTNYEYLVIAKALILEPCAIFLRTQNVCGTADSGDLIKFSESLRCKSQDGDPFLFISVINIKLQ